MTDALTIDSLPERTTMSATYDDLNNTYEDAPLDAQDRWGVYVHPDVCNDCGKLRDCLNIIRCRACSAIEIALNGKWDDYDAGESRWSADGRGHTQVSLGGLYPAEKEGFNVNG